MRTQPRALFLALGGLLLASAGGAEAPTDETPALAHQSAQVAADAPYKMFERPRPEGKVLASAHDEELARWNVGGTGDPSFISNRASYHPGARVVVDTRLVSGTLPARARGQLSQAGVLAISRSKGYWAFRSCFEAARSQGHDESGQTLLRMTIRSDGKVGVVRTLKSELSPEAAECLNKEAKALRYAPPPPRLLALDMSVKLWPGDAPLPTPPKPVPSEENPGTIPAELTQTLTRELLSPLGACYRRALERDPHLWGRLQLLLTLSAEGSLETVEQRDSRFPDAGLVSCAISEVQGRLRAAGPFRTGGAVRFNAAWRFGQLPQGKAQP